MHCLSQSQFSHSQLVSSNTSSTSLQNNPPLPSLKNMASSNSHSSSISPHKRVKRTFNDFKQTTQAEDEKGLKKPKKDNVYSKECEVPVRVMSEVNEREKQKVLQHDQEKLHCKLKPELKKLCEILKLPENVTGMADSYLGYVMNNYHQVDSVSNTSLQAFLISLCWIAASLLKYKIHHKESIALAKKHLKFQCRKEQAEYAYYLLRCLKRVFLCYNSSKAASESQDSTAYDKQLLKLNRENACVTVEGLTTGREISDDKAGLAWKDVSKSIADIKKKFDKKKKKLLKKQGEEMKKLNQQHKAAMSHLEQWKQTETVVNRHVYGNCSIAANKRDWLDKQYDKLELKMEKERKNLEEAHLVAQKKLQEREAHLVDGVNSWAHAELINKSVSRQSVDNGENLKLSNVSNENQTAKETKSISNRQGPDEIPKVSHSNEDNGGTLPNLKQSSTCDHQNVYNANASSSKELNSDVRVTMEVMEAVRSGDGLESTLNKPSLNGKSLDEPTRVNCDFGSTGCLENPASSCYSPTVEATPFTHGKSNPPAENIAAAAHDDVSMVVELDVDTQYDGQCRANGDVDTQHEKSQSGERVPEPTSCEVVESGKNGKHNGDVSADMTLDNQNIHSSDTSSKVDNQNRSDLLGKHDTAAGRGEGSGNEVEQHVSNAPELASGERAKDGSSGGEGNVVCAAASHNFAGTAPLGAECASTTARLPTVAPQSGNQNALSQVEAADSHTQNDSDRVTGGRLTNFEGHPIPTVLVYNHVESSRQANPQHTTHSSQQAVEIPRPGPERHVSVTTATPIPQPMVNYFYQASPSVQMSTQSSQDPLEYEVARITKERDQAILMHEQAKLRLSSEREKEIEEIHRKYDAKLEENESEFLLKKKKLDANHEIAVLNNILAKSWKEVINPTRTQPDLSSILPPHHMQQATQLAAQNTVSTPPVIGIPPQLGLMSPSNPYIGSAYQTPMPHPMPPLRSPARSTAPMPHLLPLSRPLTLSAGVAAPMPPLRPLAQSAGVGISYLTCPMPGQWASNILCPTSPLFSQHPSPSRPPPGFHSRAHRPGAAGVLPNFSSLSLLDEWLNDLDNQANITGNPPSNSQQQMEVASNSNPLAPSQTIVPRDPVSNCDVVHLSDDD